MVSDCKRAVLVRKWRTVAATVALALLVSVSLDGCRTHGTAGLMGLTPGLNAAEVEKRLGAPDSLDTLEHWTRWHYAARGITVEFLDVGKGLQVTWVMAKGKNSLNGITVGDRVSRSATLANGVRYQHDTNYNAARFQQTDYFIDVVVANDTVVALILSAPMCRVNQDLQLTDALLGSQSSNWQG